MRSILGIVWSIWHDLRSTWLGLATITLVLVGVSGSRLLWASLKLDLVGMTNNWSVLETIW